MNRQQRRAAAREGPATAKRFGVPKARPEQVVALTNAHLGAALITAALARHAADGLPPPTEAPPSGTTLATMQRLGLGGSRPLGLLLPKNITALRTTPSRPQTLATSQKDQDRDGPPCPATPTPT